MNTSRITPNARVRGRETGREGYCLRWFLPGQTMLVKWNDGGKPQPIGIRNLELVRPAPALPDKPHPSVGAFTDELSRQIEGLI